MYFYSKPKNDLLYSSLQNSENFIHNRYPKFFYAFILMVMFAGCVTAGKPNTDPAKWTDNQISEWFSKKEWLGKTDLIPDVSINKREFAIQYHKNKQRWDLALNFLKNENFDALTVGDHAIDSTNLFVKVSEYKSKNHEDAFFESHQLYTDIQMVISGTEYIGHTDLTQVTEKTPYDTNKDIQFYYFKKGKNLVAKPRTFFIFFPSDAHRPGLKIQDNIPVKKIVIKLKN